MSAVRTETQFFECPKLGDTAEVSVSYVVHPRITRDPSKDEVGACEQAETCGVGLRQGASITFDMTKCVHPRTAHNRKLRMAAERKR